LATPLVLSVKNTRENGRGKEEGRYKREGRGRRKGENPHMSQER